MESRYYYSQFIEEQIEDGFQDLEIELPKDGFIELNMYPDQLMHQVKTYLHGHAYFMDLKELPKQQFYLNIIAEFLKEENPLIKSFLDQDIRYLQQRFKRWMSDLRFGFIKKEFKNLYNEKLKNVKPFLETLELLCLYTEATHPRAEMEKDIWQLSRLPFPCRINKTVDTKILNFTKIKQTKFREQVKQVYRLWIKNYAVSTLLLRLNAINKFSDFMSENYPEVDEAQQITRAMLEHYLIHNNLVYQEKYGRKNNIATLKSLFWVIGKINEDSYLQEILINQDVPRVPRWKFEVYTEKEVKIWIGMIKHMEEQHARALLLHILLGTRISEILLLPQNCIREREGRWWINLTSQKSRDYCKPITKEIKDLITQAITYTRENYNNEEYVFVDRNRPTEPMKYSSMRYQMTKLISKYDMRDDNGELFKAKTHIFRRYYGVKLTELHIDDITIAKLLGHANTDSVRYYRRMGNKAMADETRKTREKMDQILLNICFPDGI